jgi:ATP-dependent Lhr-like helicase
MLLLGSMGETLTSHYSFYAVFQTSEEYRLVADGQQTGTLPVDNMIAPGMLIIFSGRRWLEEVDDRGKGDPRHSVRKRAHLQFSGVMQG